MLLLEAILRSNYGVGGSLVAKLIDKDVAGLVAAILVPVSLILGFFLNTGVWACCNAKMLRTPLKFAVRIAAAPPSTLHLISYSTLVILLFPSNHSLRPPLNTATRPMFLVVATIRPPTHDFCTKKVRLFQ